MKLKATRHDLNNLFVALMKAPLTRMEVPGKRKITDIIRALRKHAKEWDECAEVAGKKLSGDELGEYLYAEGNKTVELDIDVEPLSAEEARQLTDSNPDWTGGMMLAVEDMLTGADAEKEKEVEAHEG